jgi:hypothetical protein
MNSVFNFPNMIMSVMIGSLIFVLSYAVLSSAELPDVWFSYSTGDCVKVLNYAEGDTYSCENMPPRYYHVWTE